MKKFLPFLFFLILGTNVCAQTYREVKFDQIDSLIAKSHDTLHVVNFWATWCKPCVAELPYFRDAAIKFSDEPVKFVFISLDFNNQVETKLIPFLTKDPLPGDSWWLNERKLNSMIDKVEKNWSGAIPFTIFLKSGTQQKAYFEGELSKELLFEMIENNI